MTKATDTTIGQALRENFSITGLLGACGVTVRGDTRSQSGRLPAECLTSLSLPSRSTLSAHSSSPRRPLPGLGVSATRSGFVGQRPKSRMLN